MQEKNNIPQYLSLLVESIGDQMESPHIGPAMGKH